MLRSPQEDHDGGPVPTRGRPAESGAAASPGRLSTALVIPRYPTSKSVVQDFSDSEVGCASGSLESQEEKQNRDNWE